MTDKLDSFDDKDKPNKYGIELGLHSGISNDEYHRSPGISSSQLKPALTSMYRYNEAKCGRLPFKTTPAMGLGTAVHALVLEPDDFDNQIAVAPKFGRKKADLLDKEEFYAANIGKTIITEDQYSCAQHMRDSLLKLDDVQNIFKTGKAEQSGYYIDHKTNMLCRYRADWENDWCIADVKTTASVSPDEFSRSIAKYQYHLSAAHYLAGSKELTGQTHNWFAFLTVESAAPYEAAVYLLDEESLEAGMELRRQALDSIKICKEDDSWPYINGGIAHTIGLPGYALNKLRLKKI